VVKTIGDWRTAMQLVARPSHQLTQGEFAKSLREHRLLDTYSSMKSKVRAGT